MNLIEAIMARHSVRSYETRPLADDVVDKLQEYINQYNTVSGLRMQLVTGDPETFDCFWAHYGKFTGVTNYIAMVGAPDAAELCGYYGEKLVLEAQMLGLNTCWVGLSYKKVPGRYTIAKGEKLHLVIALGYGTTQGVMHKSKTIDKVSKCQGEMPKWFRAGVEAALLAPTAVNQQKFRFELIGDRVRATTGWGFYSKVDLGIAKLHFEIGSGKPSSIWL